MGTWGTAVFSDDTALEVREEYLRLLRDGANDRDALKFMLANWADEIADEDDGPVFWLALAATQWEYGRLSARVKSNALKVITKGEDDHRWIGSSLGNRRKAVLRRLQAKLESAQPPRRTPRRTVAEDSDATVGESPNKTAEASAWSIEKNAAGIPFTNVSVTMKVRGREGGGGVLSLHCDPTTIKFRWREEDCLEISYPREAHVSRRESQSSFYGRTIRIKYRKY